jgi:predicted small secreted protein
MKRLVLFCLVLSGCAQGVQKDLPSIGEARSLAAEWALVNEQAIEGKLTATYIKTMRTSVREQLTTISRSLSEPSAAAIVNDLLTQPDDAPPQQLRTSAEQLKQVESQLESA